MRFQLRGAHPNIYTSLQTDESWIQLEPTYWVGYQDFDHEWKTNNTSCIVGKDLLTVEQK